MNRKHTLERCKKLLMLGLLVTLLPLHTAQAAPKKNYRHKVKARSSRSSSPRDHHRLGIDVGWGLPVLGWILVATNAKSNVTPEISSKLCGSLTYGYALPGQSSVQFLPEIGIKIGTKRRVSGRIQGEEGTFEESRLQIPAVVNLRVSFSGEDLVTRYSLGVGLELDVATSYTVTETGQDPQNLLSGPDSISRFSLNLLVIPLRFTIQQGIYLATTVRIPADIATIFSPPSGQTGSQAVSAEAAKKVRIITKSMVELNLGLDVMELF